MRKLIFFILLILLSIPVNGYAKTFAYLFAKDEIIKYDTETDTITTRIKAVDRVKGFKDLKGAACAVDMVNKYWVTTSLSDRIGFYIYDLLTLKQIKFVPLPAIIAEPENLKVVYPQQGTKFYIEVNDMSLNNGVGGFVTLAYDKKTKSYIGTVNNLLNNLVDENFWFSEDQNTLHIETAEGNLRVYDSLTLSQSNTIDLSNVYAKNVWGKGIDDIKNSTALLSENYKLQDGDKNNMSFLTYNITTTATSTRVITGMDDESIQLTPDANKVVFVETQASSSLGTKAPKKGGTVTGRIHVYNAKTGSKVGLITLPTDFSGQALGIRPASDKLYYKVYSRDESKIRLEVVDLVGLKVLKEISVPNIYFMIFFDE